MAELSVIVDNRERNTDLLCELESLGLKIAIDTLPVGDYIVSDRVCIERKTISDFESSIVTGRLFEQAARLSEAYERPIIMIEGEKEEFRMKGAVISGAIASLYIDYDIPVITTFDAKESAQMIKYVVKHEQEGKTRVPSVKGGARSFTQSQFMEKIIGNIPGVGIETAKNLLDHFGTVQSVIAANEKELMKVDNVGEKRAKAIFDLMRLKYNRAEGSNLESELADF
jgi:Fanconi anemia group M protein